MSGIIRKRRLTDIKQKEGFAKKTGNDTLITFITYMVMKNKQKEFAEIVQVIDQLTSGGYDGSSKAAYDHLAQIKQAIVNSGILKV